MWHRLSEWRAACYALPLCEPATLPQQSCTDICHGLAECQHQAVSGRSELAWRLRAWRHHSMTDMSTACCLLCCRGGRAGGRGRGRGGAGGRGGRGGKRNVKDMTAEQKQVGGLSTSACCPAQHLLVCVGRSYKQQHGSVKPNIVGGSPGHHSVAVAAPAGVCGQVHASAARLSSGSLW